MTTGFTLDITDFGNASMVDDPDGEVVRILREIADKIEQYGLDGIRGRVHVRDINGNSVGTLSCSDD